MCSKTSTYEQYRFLVGSKAERLASLFLAFFAAKHVLSYWIASHDDLLGWEKPIPGITSQLIYDNLEQGVERLIIDKDSVLELAKNRDFDVLTILGAGDLDNAVPAIAKIIKEKDERSPQD